MNFYKKFKNLFEKSSGNIEIASPAVRFAAFIIDSIKIYAEMAVFLFFYIRKDLIP